MTVNKISAHVRNMKRSTYAALAVALAAVAALPILVQTVYAGGQVQTRSIEMSTAIPAATGVSYKVTFTPATNETNPDLLIDFCSNDPIIGDTCTATAGTDVPNFSSATVSSGWTLATIGSNRGVKLTTTTVSFTAGTPVTLTLSNVTNPSNLGTFYGRMIVYANGTAGTNTSDSPGTYVDYGGAALSTTQLIQITAKVMEQLTFCTSAGTGGTGDTDPFTSGLCSSAVAPTLTLGHQLTAGGPHVLDTQHVDFAKAFSLLSTNATNGAIVRMHATNTCTNGGLSATGTAGSCAIPGVGNGTGAAGSTEHAFALDVAMFGMCASPDDGVTPLSTVDVPYDNSSGTGGTAACLALSGGTPATAATTVDFGMDTTASGTNTVVDTGNGYVYGTQVLHTTGSVHNALDAYVYAAAAADTTPAGIYTGGESLIATGTF